MNHIRQDDEVEQLRQSVSCAAILEGHGWLLDRSESTRQALKYRRGAGEIIIVSHGDKGWWNPTGVERGDCFDLVQFLQPGLNFGHVRKALRQVAGIAPRYTPAITTTSQGGAAADPSIRWAGRRRLTPRSPGWHYLATVRHLPEVLLFAAVAQDAIRDGAYGSAWFAYRDDGGRLTSIEARSANYRGILTGGTKTLFRFRPVPNCAAPISRVAITEAPINAISLAAIEQGRVDTLYVATAGGIGPGTVIALQALFAALATRGGEVTIGTDNDAGGDRHAERLRAIAENSGVAATRLRPPASVNDWNDVLKQEPLR